jgi:hypothetical protein
MATEIEVLQLPTAEVIQAAEAAAIAAKVDAEQAKTDAEAAAASVPTEESITTQIETEVVSVGDARYGKSGLLSEQYPARGVAAKLTAKAATPATIAQQRVLAFGDSIALFKWHWLYPMMHRAFGGVGSEAGVSVGSAVTGPGWRTPGTSIVATTGTVTRQLNAFDIWPSGFADLFTTGATRDYGTSGVNATWDKLSIYYAKEAGSGSFKVQVDGVDEPGYENVSAAGTGLGIITITRGTVAARRVTIVNLTGTHRIIGPAFEASTRAGVVFANISQGGIALNQQTAQGYANFQAYIADFKPDIITFEMKENSNYLAAKLVDLLTVIDTAAPYATFVGIGSPPIRDNNDDQIIQNAQLKLACDAFGKVYWDGYSPCGSYEEMVALGWFDDPAGVHPGEGANAFLAGLMARDLGLFNHTGAASPQPVNTTTVTALQQFVLGLLGTLDVTGSTMHFDLASGTLEFRNASGVVVQRIGQTAAGSVLPNGAQFGDGLTRITADANGLKARSVAGNADATFGASVLTASTGRVRHIPVATVPSNAEGAAMGDGTWIAVATLDFPLQWKNAAWRKFDGTVYAP